MTTTDGPRPRLHRIEPLVADLGPVLEAEKGAQADLGPAWTHSTGLDVEGPRPFPARLVPPPS